MVPETRHEFMVQTFRLFLTAALLQLTGCSATVPIVESSDPVVTEASGPAVASRDGEPHLQSPIDLPAEPLASGETHEIALRYHETMEHLIHRDHTIELEYDPGSTLEFDQRSFVLDQLHFHTPSEHLIAHRRFPVEMHLVHHSSDGGLLVLGILFESGDPSAFVERILEDVPSDIGRLELDRDLNVAELLPEEAHFYTYTGSLTTPPYTEGVQWLILRDQPSLSSDQVVRLLVLEGGNAREVQPLNERSIEGD